jgi:hypothetical protein
MGEIVGAGFLAHVPTIVLPDAERRELNEGRESSLYTGLHQLRRDVFDVVKPDLVRDHLRPASRGVLHLRRAASGNVQRALRRSGRSGLRRARGRDR